MHFFGNLGLEHFDLSVDVTSREYNFFRLSRKPEGRFSVPLPPCQKKS